MLRPLRVGDRPIIMGLGLSQHKKLSVTSAGTATLVRAPGLSAP